MKAHKHTKQTTTADRCFCYCVAGEECCPNHPDAQVLSLMERPRCECATDHGEGPQCSRLATRLVKWKIRGDRAIHQAWCCTQHADEMER